MNQQSGINNKVLFAYGAIMTPVMYGYVLMLIMYMKYAVDDLGVEPAVVGVIFLIAKVWDAVSDPIIGNVSDRTELEGGRRKPWLLIAAPLIAVFGVMAWSPPDSLHGVQLSLWVGVAVIGFYTAFTMFDVPHMALGAEITLKTSERDKVFGVRQFMRILGTAAAGILGTYLVSQGASYAEAMAYALGLLTVIVVVTGVSFLPPERASFKGRGGSNPYKALRDVWVNPHARLLLFVVFIDAIGVGGIGVLMPFLVNYVIKEGDLLPVFMALNMAASLIMVPGWIFLAKYFEKAKLLLWSFVVSGLAYGLIILVGENDWHIMVVSCLLAGGATTCTHVLGYSLKSEIIDCDEFLTGERKEGTYFAGWSFVNKLAHGIMIGLVGFTLQWSDFQPNIAEQSHLVKQNIVLLMGGLPLVCFLVGALVFTRFSLTPVEYAKVRLALDARG
ncbi:MFS transporter [Zhongshania borealis]|uniref:MFS transporter n=1 Tax=Zhongshania borealis TaxID=889488 RepID=A0ABP7X3W3_9GAMM